MDEALPTPLVRHRRGRWLGGVCSGLAARWTVPVARVRLGFAVAGLMFGLGVMVYIAAWLILPGESEDGVTPGQRGIVLLAQAGGALIALATLAGLGTAATIFGFGWVIVALAGAILVGVLAGWSRLGPAWALLPIGALVLPSAALAIGGVEVDPSADSVTVEPRTSAELGTYKSGLGLLTLDLRRTTFPASGRVEMRVEAGLRRTLVALPHDRCVHVEVQQRNPPLALRAGAVLLGEGNLASPTPIVFGQYGARSDLEAAHRNGRATPRVGPTLVIDYSTMGGELIVRDYPNSVSPRSYPDWPGYEVYPEERPDTTGLSDEGARRVIDEWTSRRTEQVADQARIERLMSGPCAEAPVAEPRAKRKPKKRKSR
ncbi:PspC domain-containing protein [Solirubrobacter sp. CPCC 204708]|uniref:PspC domain-containing protein n=1 Tax=Solirubrobacter deserti TaxID=2282478 RepID=A0ABT4RG45_9ACTN|nr:PspC domain-containing protein [Solirubrobacter deserti]MBE2318199.1 PspC domain-containing protein [Solirubrobacter deserti]MDA0137480.1 PspC domain-containing protein [Solirubrobacter deserti]